MVECRLVLAATRPHHQVIHRDLLQKIIRRYLDSRANTTCVSGMASLKQGHRRYLCTRARWERRTKVLLATRRVQHGAERLTTGDCGDGWPGTNFSLAAQAQNLNKCFTQNLTNALLPPHGFRSCIRHRPSSLNLPVSSPSVRIRHSKKPELRSSLVLYSSPELQH